jgi:hypothetical protein
MQIEIERFFKIVRLFTSLWHCHFGITILDVLVMVYKNWLVDVQKRCSFAFVIIVKFLFGEVKIHDKHEDGLGEASYLEED